MSRYIIEVRDKKGQLDFKAKAIKRREHPYLFSQQVFTIDQLCYYASFGQGRDNALGPMELPAWMAGMGISYRVKTW